MRQMTKPTWHEITAMTLGVRAQFHETWAERPNLQQFFNALQAALKHHQNHFATLTAQPVMRITHNDNLLPYSPMTLAHFDEGQTDLTDMLHQITNKSVGLLQNPSIRYLSRITEIDPGQLLDFFKSKKANIGLLFSAIKGGYSLMRHIPNMIALYQEFQALLLDYKSILKAKTIQFKDITEASYLYKIFFTYFHYLLNSTQFNEGKLMPELVNLVQPVISEFIDSDFEDALFKNIDNALAKREQFALESFARLSDDGDEIELDYFPVVVSRFDEVVRAYHHLALLFPERYEQLAKQKISEIVNKLSSHPLCVQHQINIDMIAENWEKPNWPATPVIEDPSMIVDIDDPVAHSEVSAPHSITQPDANRLIVQTALSGIIQQLNTLAGVIRGDQHKHHLYEGKLARPWEILLGKLQQKKTDCSDCECNQIMTQFEDSSVMQQFFDLLSKLQAVGNEFAKDEYQYIINTVVNCTERYQAIYTALLQRDSRTSSQTSGSDPSESDSFDDEVEVVYNPLLSDDIDVDQYSDDDDDALVIQIPLLKAEAALSTATENQTALAKKHRQSMIIEYLDNEDNNVDCLFDEIFHSLRPYYQKKAVTLFEHAKTDCVFQAKIDSTHRANFFANDDLEFMMSLTERLQAQAESDKAKQKCVEDAYDFGLRPVFFRNLLAETLKQRFAKQQIPVKTVLIGANGGAMTLVVDKAISGKFVDYYVQTHGHHMWAKSPQHEPPKNISSATLTSPTSQLSY